MSSKEWVPAGFDCLNNGHWPYVGLGDPDNYTEQLVDAQVVAKLSDRFPVDDDTALKCILVGTEERRVYPASWIMTFSCEICNKKWANGYPKWPPADSNEWIDIQRAAIIHHSVLGPAVLREAVNTNGDTVFYFQGRSAITLSPQIKGVEVFSPACGGFTTLERLVEKLTA